MIPSQKVVYERRCLTTYEQKILFPNDKEERVKVWGNITYATYFSVMYDTGFRPGEVISLRACDVYQTPRGYAVLAEKSYDSYVSKVKNDEKKEGLMLLSHVIQFLAFDINCNY